MADSPAAKGTAVRKTAGKAAPGVRTASKVAKPAKPVANASSGNASFEGFSKGAQAYYADIAKNNNKEWFDAHRAAYMTNVIAPAKAFVNTMGPLLQKLSPGIGFNDDHNGRGSIKKIVTDKRFNPDRDTYKTYLDIMFWEGPAPVKKENPAFYLHLEAKSLSLAGGAMYFEPQALKAYRAAVLDPKSGPELDKICQALWKAGYKDGGKEMKQAPRGTPADFPRLEYLKYTALCFYYEKPTPPELHSAKLLDYCLTHFKEMLPLHKWLLKVYEKAYG